MDASFGVEVPRDIGRLVGVADDGQIKIEALINEITVSLRLMSVPEQSTAWPANVGSCSGAADSTTRSRVTATSA